MSKNNQKGPRILILDVETKPLLGYVWGLWENNIALNQLHTDWCILSWAAKWAGDPVSKVMYMDQRNEKNIDDDKKLLQGVWKLLDEADIVVTHNGVKFDTKKLNARFILQGMAPPSPFKNIDTCIIASKKFGFSSNKLEYLTHALCTRFKKQLHKKFAGFELWTACIAGNKAAWAEMRKYNVYDVLALEELYTMLAPWDNTINFNIYREDMEIVCQCGCKDLERRGFHYTTNGKHQRYRCCACGAWTHDKQNLLSKEKIKSLKKSTT